ncbi:hypothetical protein D3C78_1344010 [compost metagenome]
MFHQTRGVVETTAAKAVLAQLVLDGHQLFGQHLAEQRFCHRFAVAEGLLVMDPLPDGGTRNLSRRGIFHQTVNRYAAVTRNPRFDVLHGDANIGAHTGFSPFAFAGREKFLCSDRRIVFPTNEKLVLVIA